MNQLKLFSFYLLNDTKSENTLMLLNFLNNNIKTINKNGIKVKFNLVNQDEIKKEDFIAFIKKKNIKNIPCIINETDNEVISGMDEILHLLKALTNDNKKNNKHMEEEDEEEKYNTFMQNYLFNEMTKPDVEEDRFDEENNKKDLGDKLRALEKQRKGGGNCKVNYLKNNNNSIEEEDDFTNKIANKIKIKIDRDIDQDSLTKQLLDKIDDD